MKDEMIFENAVHRPRPDILVGFTQSDHEKMEIARKNARAFMLRLIVDNDGLTHLDRLLLDKARHMVYDWKSIMDMCKEAESNNGREKLRQELNRAYDNEIKRRKMQYDR